MPVTQIDGTQIQPGVVTDVHVNAANKDGLNATPCMRTLGTGTGQALPGNTVITIPGQPTNIWTNKDTGTHSKGQAVYLSNNDGVKLAKADAISTINAVALVADATIAASAAGNYQTAGILGGLSGLTLNATYYLDDATAGNITSTPPSTTGHYIVEIGVAVSTTEILIRPRIMLAL
jgi:hypothetical protein